MAVVINGTTGITNPNGSAGAPAFTGQGSNTGLYFPSNTSAGIATAGLGRLVVDANGYTTMPYQPMACVNLTTAGTTSSGVYELAYDSIQVNIGSHYNASNGRFTCPVAGVYRVSAFGMGQLIAGDHNFYVTVRKNGGQIGGTAYNYGSPTDYKHASGNWLISCSAGDYLSIYVGGSSGYYGNGYQAATFQLVG